jgi:four helix bundle protein
MPHRLDHERLDVYQLELQFVAWCEPLLRHLVDQAGPTVREVADHLDRAALSALLNTAEGNGKRQEATRAKFFDIARGSATECAACLDALVAKRACGGDDTSEGKALLVRIVSMLTKPIQRYTPGGRIREDETEYNVNGKGQTFEADDEDEDDDEDD